MSDIQNAQSASTATFLAALIFNSAVFAAEITLFTLLRPYFKAIYEPRTYVPPPDKRVPPLSTNILLWPWKLYTADYEAILSHNGLDAYFFVRFLRVFAITLLPIWIISWCILLPITSVNTSVPGLSGLDRFTFGNVEPSKQVRYSAHLICVYGFTFWIFYVIKKEMRHFLLTRQKHLIEKHHAKSVQANTILITGIPRRHLTYEALYKLFNCLPGGVRKIWINRDLKELPKIYDRRMKATDKLEAAETKVILETVKTYYANKGSSSSESNNPDVEASSSSHEDDLPILTPSQRPTHKLGFLGLFGEKVDTIEWAREEIVECNRLLEQGQAKIEGYEEFDFAGEVVTGVDDDIGESDEGEGATEESAAETGGGGASLGRHFSHHAKSAVKHAAKSAEIISKTAVQGAVQSGRAIKERVTGHVVGGDEEYPRLNSAFVMFRKQIAAHLAVQVVAHHEPYRMSDRYIEVHPSDVIWANLNLNPYETKIRTAISYALTAGLIILWAFPVAFIGTLSNLYSVCDRYSFLGWICSLPKVVVGVIQGILPPVLLAVLMMILPIILRLLARLEGIPKYTGLELSLMNRYFIFLVVHSFLIVSLSSGIIASLGQFASNPGSIPTVLAQNLPKASTFFLTFILLQGLTGTASGFLQIVSLVLYYVKLFILGSTSRSVWSIKYVPGSVAWGTLWPNMMLLVVVTLGYSIISPIINGLAALAFFLFYLLYKYLFLYVLAQPSTSDTGGLFYPKAMQQVFVGLYVQQVCLCGLFFLAGQGGGKVLGAFMIVLIVVTAGFNIIINHSYGPLLYALPLSLVDKTYTQPVQRAHKDEPSAMESEQKTGKRPLGVVPKASASGDGDLEAGGGGGSSRAVMIEGGVEVIEEERTEIEQENRTLKPSRNQEDLLSSLEDTEQSYGFSHPAISRPQRTIWIPKDEGDSDHDHDVAGIGIAQREKKECEERGVRVSWKDAWVKVKVVGKDKKGKKKKGGKVKTKVEVGGGTPPDLIGVVI